MKIIVVALLFTISFSMAYSEIPDSIKDKTQHLAFTNNLNEKTITSIIEELSRHKIIKNTKEISQIYTIPTVGKIDFVKISGRIDEFGRTAQVDLQIMRPDGTIDYIKSPLLETGWYSTIYPIDPKSQIGTYLVESHFAGEIKSKSYFHLTKTKLPSTNFPLWLLNTFEWWIQDKITDSELVYSVQYLTDLGLITTHEKPSSSMRVVISGEEMVRRGTTHAINVHVTDGYSPIEGAKITLTIEDYGDNIIREFNGYTNKEGHFVFSWEIPKSFDDYKKLLAYISVSGNGSSQTHLWEFQVYCLPGTANCDIDGN